MVCISSAVTQLYLFSIPMEYKVNSSLITHSSRALEGSTGNRYCGKRVGIQLSGR